ncbi:predicted protein [Sclerotinia sclerotiorum 1980 UF-70]|uniref:Uncharacterized protein n=1 Tax=Sclerotinia sclerotiorum (strain ATCC 18683 / 1980 / Ss-1) TaxID=665079 RepID=A7E515_SCLS1|nr:predicted protein [Sclerotinia sclerotiorum 1980 UF-70]EDN90987.1 predicted protein [Sclerotinia sclerotiorum 1980 UF-70]
MCHTWEEICFICKRATGKTEVRLCPLAREPEHEMERSETVCPVGGCPIEHDKTAKSTTHFPQRLFGLITFRYHDYLFSVQRHTPVLAPG